jgi:hypothetical protein
MAMVERLARPSSVALRMPASQRPGSTLMVDVITNAGKAGLKYPVNTRSVDEDARKKYYRCTSNKPRKREPPGSGYYFGEIGYWRFDFDTSIADVAQAFSYVFLKAPSQDGPQVSGRVGWCRRDSQSDILGKSWPMLTPSIWNG